MTLCHRVINVIAVRRECHAKKPHRRRRDDLRIAVGDGHLPQPKALLLTIILNVHQPLAIRRHGGAGRIASRGQTNKLRELERNACSLVAVKKFVERKTNSGEHNQHAHCR